VCRIPRYTGQNVVKSGTLSHNKRAARIFITNVDFGVVTMPKKTPNPIDKYVGSRVRMRRMLLNMSQEKLGNALRLTFQQVQKYEKGTNRIGASRLHNISDILQVPVSFFFDGAPATPHYSSGKAQAPSPAFISDFLASADGISLTKAFISIGDGKLRRRIVELVEQIASRND
jgi:transcriptional regulator with XRE-family HTH domain